MRGADMAVDKDNLIKTISDMISGIDYVRVKDVPDIGLYMDQVTSFMEKELKSAKRHDDDKILTKTMINNYAKNKLLPPPDKKKYSREHLLLLTFIYYFKSFLSISDIENLLRPVTERYFGSERGMDISRVYEKICEATVKRVRDMKSDIKATYEASGEIFGPSEDDDDFLRLFAFICELGADIYVRKMIVEKLIDMTANERLESDTHSSV